MRATDIDIHETITIPRMLVRMTLFVVYDQQEPMSIIHTSRVGLTSVLLGKEIRMLSEQGEAEQTSDSPNEE
jgi:hypothetical protein